MNVHQRSQPRSRRERPAKPALSRAWIVEETIAIMRSEGLEKATMRRVAQALDTGPASLCVDVANTTELHAAVPDELLGTLSVREHGDSARSLDPIFREDSSQGLVDMFAGFDAAEAA